jgi:flagellar biosynthesis anti-sigma factor FlgM
MAIELIKNGAAVSAPVKPHQKDNVNSKSFELTLSNIESKSSVVASEAVVRTDSVVLNNSFTAIKKSVDFSRESSIDTEKVARLKQAIENGTYKINPDRIATKMLHYAM